MNSSLIPAEDTGVWDELSHQQSREIEQHLYQHRQHPQQHHPQSQSQQGSSGFVVPQVVQQTVTRIRSAATAAASSIRHTQFYRPVVPEQTNHLLSDFGIPNEDHLLENHHHNANTSTTTTSPMTGYPSNSKPPPQPPNKNEFVFLENFRLLPKQDGWGAVANLDLFFTSLYNYYYHRGFMPIMTKGVVELVTLFITLWLSVFLFVYVDWKGLSTCHGENSCRPNFGDYLVDKPFQKVSLWNFIVVLYAILFTCYGVFSVWSFWHTLKDAWEAKRIFEERLGVSPQRLVGGAVDWDKDVVSKLLHLQETGDYRVAIHGQGHLDALVIAQRILRKENFLIAFFNRGNLLDLTVFGLRQTFFCKSLEWSLYFCVLNYMFNHKYHVRPAFYLDPMALKRRFMLCGIAHAIFMPFLLFFMTLHFAMQNVYDWKSTKEYLGPREWSLSAKWTLREFNELPHFFERRMEPSYEASDKYLKLFVQSEVMTMIGRILAFVGGSFGAVLLLFAALNDAIVLHVKIGDWNLLWYMGVMGVIFSAGKSMLPNREVHPRYIGNLSAEMDSALANVATHTHHYPDSWRGKGFDMATYKAVSAMFKYKAQLFVLELMSVVVAPVILCISLPNCAEQICEFVMGVKAEVPGAGEVCGFASFDFDSFQDESWEGRTLGKSQISEMTGSLSASVHQLNDVEAAAQLHEKPQAWHGKMEKSFFSFKACHPSWKSTKSGQNLVDIVEQYKKDETMALAREQQQHIAAAARQLDTLAMLENRAATHLPGLATINDAYIDSTRPPQADAGAGSGGTVVAETPSAPRVQFSGVENPATRDPPPFAVPHESTPSNPEALLRQSSIGTGNTGALSVLHYADIGLSTELRRVLNRSTLDSEMTAGSVLGGPSIPSLSGNYGQLRSLAEDVSTDEQASQRTAREFLWLQRYHSHLTERRRTRPGITQSYLAPTPDSRVEDAAGRAASNHQGLARSSNL